MISFPKIGALTALAGLAALLAAPAAHADLITNGGFETGDFTGWTQGGNTGTTFVTAAGFAGYNPNSGTYFAALGPVGSDGTLSQTFATTVGENYDISFSLASNGTQPSDFSVQFDGTTLLSFPGPVLPATGDSAPYPYVDYSFVEEAATSTSSTLEFTFRNDPNYDALDDVSVTDAGAGGTPPTAAPEPSAVAPFALGGLGLLGLALRARRRQTAPAA